MSMVNVERVADALNVTPRRVQQLVKEGLPREKRGEYDPIKCMLWRYKLATQVTAEAFCGRGNFQAHGEKPLAPRAGSLGGSRGEEEFRPEGLELIACLINSDAILKKAANDRQPKYGTGVESEFIPFRELRVCGDGNGDVGWPANAQSGEPLSCDTDNREGMAFDANLFPDYVERTAKASLPELVAKHCYLR